MLYSGFSIFPRSIVRSAGFVRRWDNLDVIRLNRTDQMKTLFRFKLRTLLLLVGAFSVFGAVGSAFLAPQHAQMRNVQKLKALGEHSDEVLFGVTVWYGNELSWNENEKRHELASAEMAGFKRWICNWAGKDFAFSPISIEIDCDEFDKSILTQEMIDQIRRLPTIQQVWVEEFGNEQTRQATTDALRKIFPDLIIASSQRTACHDAPQPNPG